MGTLSLLADAGQKDTKTLKKINELLEDIRRNGAMKGIGKPERLKYRPDIPGGLMKRIDLFMILMNCRILK